MVESHSPYVEMQDVRFDVGKVAATNPATSDDAVQIGARPVRYHHIITYISAPISD